MKEIADWSHWLVLFEVQKARFDIRLVDFCRTNNLSYETARKAFRRLRKSRSAADKSGEDNAPHGIRNGKKHRHDWPSLKVQFLKGDYKTIAEFSRALGLNVNNSHFKKQTRGWVELKAQIQAESEMIAVAKISDLTVDQLHNEMVMALHDAIAILRAARLKHAQVVDWISSPLDLKFFIACAAATLGVAERFVPFLQKIIGSKEAVAILERYRTGEINVIDACLQLEILGVPLPQTLKIALSKQQPEEGDIIPGGPVPSDEELEQIYREGLAKIQEQESFFVPARKKEIEKLKKDAKQSGSYGGQEGKGGEERDDQKENDIPR